VKGTIRVIVGAGQRRRASISLVGILMLWALIVAVRHH
jgi:hypothetical protein